jgi:nucleotidyltransferase substrate binding protein (TIGR01987 family)
MEDSKSEDIRWEQRFVNFNKAFTQFEKFLEKEKLNELENQGLIKAFEYTFELSWNTLQDLLIQNGYKDVRGPRPVIQQSFQDGYIKDGMSWMKMLKGRNMASHTYNEDTAKEIILDIRNIFFNLLSELKYDLEKLRSSRQGDIF